MSPKRRKPLHDAETNQIAWRIRDGKADPKEARLLMREFVKRFDAYGTDLLLRHFAQAFDNYLSGRRKIESALGLKRGGAGNPGKSEEHIAWAVDVLLEYIRGAKMVVAQGTVAKARNVSTESIKKAWQRCAYDACVRVSATPPEGMTGKSRARFNKIWNLKRGARRNAKRGKESD